MINEAYDAMKKLALAGIGAAAISVDKTKELVDRLVEQGELTVEQGKVANQKLKHDMEEKAKGCVTINNYSLSADEFIKNVDSLSEEQLAALREKLAGMENKAE